jgi:glutathione S-transferase
MFALHHHPFSPHSRFVRLVLAEHGLTPELIEERPWERREALLTMNPAGSLPVLVDEDGTIVAGAGPIAEYLDETRGAALGDRRIMPLAPAARAEVRRLLDWFNMKFFDEVVDYLVTERIYKLQMPRGSPPDTAAIRAARANVRWHLQYIGHLMSARAWLAGDRLSLADLAAAAQLSSIDYLGEVPWEEDQAAKDWYARIKSRPSFRPLLAETVRGIPPAAVYADLDF